MEAIKLHGNKYDYSHVEYINSHIKIKIKCMEHGIFEQTPNYHLSGGGCKKCYLSLLLTNEEFIKESNKIHKHIYDYSHTDYVSIKNNVKIKCHRHGIFEQRPDHHLRGHGCPKCVNNFSKKTNCMAKLPIKTK